MPTLATIRKVLAAAVMTVGALCGGAKASAEQKGTLSVVGIEADAAITPQTRRRATEFLRGWLVSRGHADAVVQNRADGALAVWTKKGIGGTLSDLPEPATFGLHAVDESVSEEDLHAGKVPEGRIILPRSDMELPSAVYAEAVVSEADLLSVDAEASAYAADWVVNLALEATAAQRFGEMSAKAIGKPIAIVVDDKIVSAPIVREPIFGGKIQISGGFSQSEAEELVARLLAPLSVMRFRVKSTCTATRPRAPPDWMPKWTVVSPLACD